MLSFKYLGRWVVVCVLATMGFALRAHESEQFEQDRLPPYNGPGWRAVEGGAPPILFAQSGVELQSWIPLVEFDPSVTSADDCWGYVSGSGREYALIGLSIGTGVVDVSDPRNARIVTVIPGPTSIWRDIKIFQHYAYVVSEGGSGIQVLDLSQIDNNAVTLVNTVTTGGRLATHNVIINEQSGFLYRAGGGGSPPKGLRVYDLSDPVNPQFVAEWSVRYCHDAQVVNWTTGPFAGREIAFCFGEDTSGGVNAGVDILDVTDKSNITRIVSFHYSNAQFSHQGWLSPDRHYLYVNDEIDELAFGTPTTTRVVDVSDLANPVEVATFTNGSPSIDHNLYTLGNLIFESNYRSGLRVYDATNPTAPVEIGFFDTFPPNDSANFNGLWNNYPFFPSGIVIGSDLEKGLFVWSVGGLRDCNGNGILDGLDITSGTSQDCNFNVVPDECEPNNDCNGNGSRDICEIAANANLDCNVNHIPDDCDIASGFSNDVNANGVPDECCAIPLEAQSVPVIATNRYLTITPGNPGSFTALGVTLSNLPPPFEAFEGTQMWVGAPRDVSENGGVTDPTLGFPTFKIAQLQCDPVMLDWGSVGPVAVFGDAVVPGATYDVRAISEDCLSTGVARFSLPLVMSTATAWGDVTGTCAVTPCSPPDGVVDVITDVIAILNKFKEAPGAPSKVRADLEPNIPDQIINITDVISSLQAFSGNDYPFAGPSGCP